MDLFAFTTELPSEPFSQISEGPLVERPLVLTAHPLESPRLPPPPSGPSDRDQPPRSPALACHIPLQGPSADTSGSVDEPDQSVEEDLEIDPVLDPLVSEAPRSIAAWEASV